MGLCTVPGQSTMDRRPVPHARAHQSSASGRSGGRGCRTRGGGGKGEHGGPGSGLTMPRKAGEWRHIGGEGGGGESSGTCRSGLGNGARWSEGGELGGGDAGAPFYRVRGAAGRPGVEGERAVAVVRHNGVGGGRFGRGWTGVVVGSDEGGGVLQPLRERKGRREAARARTRGNGGGHLSGEEDDRVGPVCQREGAVG
jgi:hypothetical protein